MSQQAFRVSLHRKGQRRAERYSPWFFIREDVERCKTELEAGESDYEGRIETSDVGCYFVSWADQRTRIPCEEVIALPMRDVAGALRQHIFAKIGHTDFKIYRSYLQSDCL